MANAKRDENSVTTLIGTLNSDGATIVLVKVNPTNHGLKVSDGTTGSDHGPTYALRDENSATVLTAASSADGTTPIAVYVDSSNNLLVKST